MFNFINLLPFDQHVIDTINLLVGRITTEFQDVVSIVLFGSYARCTYKATSDIDLFVVTENKYSNWEVVFLREFFNEHNADLVLCDLNNVTNKDNILLKQIREDGITIWGSTVIYN